MSMIRVTLQWVIFIITVRGYNSQIDGEFWWLNDKITELKSIKPERPKFETISEFDTDENDVIVFKEDSMFKRVNSDIHTKNASTENTFFFEEIKINSNNNTLASNESKPIEVFAKPFHSTNNATPTKANAVKIKHEEVNTEKPTEAPIGITETRKKPRHDLRDRLTFGIVERSRHSTISWPRETKRGDMKPNIVTFGSEKFKIAEEACICVSKEACKRLGGVQSTNRTHSRVCSEESACCIPANEVSSKIVFPGQTPKGKLPKTSTQRVRFIRSADTDIIPGQDRQSSGQKPRPIDLFWERVRTIDPKLPPSHRNPRIVTGDDDPYWNIKNVFAISNVSRPRHKISTGYATPDYGDYTMELPRPGLHQIYSEETPRPMDQSWGGNGYSYGSYGSPVLDPRYDHVTISTDVSVRPIPKRTKAPESEEIIDEEAEFANSYHATSQYQTFEDFKLPSLFRDKTKTRKTTERPQDYDSSESVAVAPNKWRPLEPGYYGKKEQAYAKCGEVPFGDDDRNVYGAAKTPRFGSRPWLCLVTHGGSSGPPRCSATLLHPRAALTSASCVHGTRRGELTVRCGEWELDANSAPLASQRRRAAARAHRLYRAGDLTNDLAVLYWESPMELCASVQPACLDDPLDGDTCIFVGWGGADNVFHRRPREQRAVVLSARACAAHVERVSGAARAPHGVFCARALTHGCACIQLRGNDCTVRCPVRCVQSGAGGSLVCGARRGAVGVASWRASCDVSAPVVLNAARDWTLRTLTDLEII